MLNKIYLVAIAVFVLGMIALTFLAFSWLGSVTAPLDVKANFESYMALGRAFLWISTLILLVLANVILWKTQNAWAFWTTLLYFVFFILLQTFWLDRSFMQFQKEKGLTESTLSISPLVGVLLVIIAVGIVYFNQFFVRRMHDRMFAKDAEIQDLADEAEINADEKPAAN